MFFIKPFYIPNPSVFFNANSCYSPTLAYNSINPYKGACGDGCYVGTYKVAMMEMCGNCDASCTKCSATTCTSCPSGYIVSGTTCIVDPGPAPAPPPAPAPDPAPAPATATQDSPGTISLESSMDWFTVDKTTQPATQPYDNNSELSNISSLNSNEETIKILETQALSPPSSSIDFSSSNITENEEPEINCGLGFVLVGNICKSCPKGCLSCPDVLTCSMCDAHYELTAKMICIMKAMGMLNDTTSMLLQSRECGSCYQVYTKQSLGCLGCNNTCHCHVNQSSYDNSFNVVCDHTLLDAQNLEQKKDNSLYYTKASSLNFELRVHLKRRVTSTIYPIDLSFVKNTTGCIIRPNTTFTLESTSTAIFIPPIPITETEKETIELSSESLINLVGLFSLSAATMIIGFLQFNKFFYYLSTCDVMVGGLYDYINFYVYGNRKDEQPWMLMDDQQVDFSYADFKYYGSKLIRNKDIQRYIIFAAVCYFLLLAGKYLRQNTHHRRLSSFGQSLTLQAKKFNYVISRRYLPLISVSLSYLLQFFRLIRPTLFQFIYLVLLLLMFKYSLSMRLKALAFINGQNDEKNAYFGTLKSPNQIEKNRMLLKAKIIEELFYILKIMAIYHLRMYKLPALIGTLVLIACEMTVSVIFIKKLHLIQTILIFVELLSLSAFVSLMILKYFSIIQSVLIFDIVFLICNCAKLVSTITQIVLVARKNQEDKRRQDMLMQRRTLRNRPLEFSAVHVGLAAFDHVQETRRIYYE